MPPSALAAPTVLLTGATDGIGLALARRLDARGVRLLLLGRRPPETLADPLFERARYLHVDLAHDAAAQQVVALLDLHGVDALDRIVHNAAVGDYGPPAEQRADRLDDLLQVDLKSPLALTHALLPRLRPAGSVTFVGSVAADLPAPDYAAYAAAKAALAGFARALRAEGIAAQMIHPGATRTGMQRKSGVPDGAHDRSGWPDAEAVAAQLERTLEGGRPVVTLGIGNAALRWAGRHLPGLVDRLATRTDSPSEAPPPPVAPRCAVVTGAASGIGRAFALRLAADGWRVIGIDRDVERAEEVERYLCAVAPAAPERHWITAELSSDAGLERVERELAPEFGAAPCDLLVHSAGINAVGRFARVDLATHLAVLDVNLRAPLQLTRALLAAGALRRGAAVVAVSSLSHYVGYPGAASYAASKDGIAAWARSLGVALAPEGIHVLTVFPGPTRTPHARQHSPPGSDESRRMEPERVAEGALRALAQGRRRYVPGLANKLFARFGRLAPGVTEAALRRSLLERIDP